MLDQCVAEPGATARGDFEVPTLFSDATAQWDATRQIIDCDQPPIGYEGEHWIDEDGSIAVDYDYPQRPIIGPVVVAKAATPHVSYRQVLFSGAASKFQDEKTGANNVARVRRYIEARSVGFERILVICQLFLESKLLELGIPPNVETAHFNQIRGRDEWKDSDLLIVIGRTQPPPNAMELNAEVLFHAQCKSLGPEYYYDRVWVPLTATDVEVEAERHPDPLVEMMRWRVCEAELIQAIGRGRGVNRTEADPLQVDLINTVPLPDIMIDEVVTWDDAQPDPGVVIAGRYGLFLAEQGSKGTADVVAALLPDLFGTANAARQARMYSRAETPNKEYLLGVSAREYISGPAGDPVTLLATACRYAVRFEELGLAVSGASGLQHAEQQPFVLGLSAPFCGEGTVVRVAPPEVGASLRQTGLAQSFQQMLPLSRPEGAALHYEALGKITCSAQ